MSQQVECIIVGQGLAGIFTSFYLYQSGISFKVINFQNPYTATIHSSGIFNPVTGRKFQHTWNIETFMPFAKEAYRQLEHLLGKQYFFDKPIYKYFSNAESAAYYDIKVGNRSPYTQKLKTEELLHDYLNDVCGAIKITPAYSLFCKSLFHDFRKWLIQNELIIEEPLLHHEIEINDKQIVYKNINAKKIIFCEGYLANQNPWFNNIPVIPNKGEYLLVKIPGLPKENIIHHGFFIIPLEDDLFWAGSNYNRDFNSPLPTEALMKLFKAQLKQSLKIPFEIINHFSGIRPTTIDRRPIVGTHAKYKNIAILNGLGTKGVSLAPYFAHHLIQHLYHQSAIDKEVQWQRFVK